MYARVPFSGHFLQKRQWLEILGLGSSGNFTQNTSQTTTLLISFFDECGVKPGSVDLGSPDSAPVHARKAPGHFPPQLFSYTPSDKLHYRGNGLDPPATTKSCNFFVLKKIDKNSCPSPDSYKHDFSFFGPARPSRDGLRESRLRSRCCGGPPDTETLPDPGPSGPPNPDTT